MEYRSSELKIIMSAVRVRLTKLLSQNRPKQPKRPPQKKSWDIYRGDKVQVIGDHPEAGKQGKVLHVLRKQHRLIIENVNMGAKTLKGDPDRGIKERVVQVERSAPYSNANLVDPVTNKPTRIHKTFLDDGTKVRIAKKSGTIIPRPDILRFRKKPVSSTVTESDTIEEDVWEKTFLPKETIADEKLE